MSLSFAGRISARLGASMNLYFELTRAMALYTHQGFHPVVGFLPSPKILSASEKQLWTSCLQYLKAGFEEDRGVLTTKVDAIEFGMWVYAANSYIEFVIDVTREIPPPQALEESDGYQAKNQGESMGIGPYAHIPPYREARQLTELEKQVYEAALSCIVRSHSTKASENVQLELAVSLRPETPDEAE
jgi:hypothetical protein